MQAEPAQTEPAPTAPGRASSRPPASSSPGRSRTASGCSATSAISAATSRPRAGAACFEAEQDLAEASEGRGWARDMVVRLCLDAVGQVADQCTRDGVRENYLAPADHRIEVRASGEIATGAACTWSFADGDAKPRVINADCERAGVVPRALRPHHHGDRRHRGPRRADPTRHGGHRGARSPDRRARRLRRVRATAIPTARWRSPTRASVSAASTRRGRRNFSARAASAFKGDRVLRFGQRRRTTATAGRCCRRDGWAAHATARSTVTSSAPRSGSRSRTRISR